MAENKRERRGRLFRNAVESLQLESPTTEISEKTRYGKGNISKILNGKLQPSSNFIQLFENTFGVNIEDFDFNGEEKAPAEETRFEVLVAKNVVNGLKPLLVDFQEGHRYTHKQVQDLVNLSKVMAASIDALQDKVQDIDNRFEEVEKIIRDISGAVITE